MKEIKAGRPNKLERLRNRIEYWWHINFEPHKWMKEELALMPEGWILEKHKKQIYKLARDISRKNGLSGGSVGYYAGHAAFIIRNLILQKPIAPMQGTPNEFREVGTNTWQNKRCSALFKNGSILNKAHYLDAITWKVEDGGSWGGSAKTKDGKRYSSCAYVKSWPFEPKTFAILCKWVDDELIIDNAEDLEEVFEYYDEYPAKQKS